MDIQSVKTNAVTVYNDARMTYYQTGLYVAVSLDRLPD
jgi:hypothetical protein